MAQGLVKGKKWFSLTADYAFGHDLLKVAKRFMEANGGQFAADKLVPTDATDFSALLLEIRAAKPDLVISNLAGNQITNFLKQYAEFGLTFPVAGFGFDTALAWAAGKDNFAGIWPCVWHHLIDTPGTKAFVAAFTKKYGKPPENQAWGDYMAVKIMAQSMNELKSTETAKILEHWEKGAKFDVLKGRPAISAPRTTSSSARCTRSPRCRRPRSRTHGTSSPPHPPCPARTRTWRSSPPAATRPSAR